jgi:uncharacterized membrane protein YeaQ/YmgE (transglycosylase-associated protein family)
MYSSNGGASMSIVAEIVGSVLGRQVAMAIFRQTENGMADLVSVIGNTSPQDATKTGSITQCAATSS